MTNSYSFFANTDCKYNKCHGTTIDREDFNCIFCYCPLYRLENCPGNYTILPNGVKDCSACDLPHRAENYETIVELLKEINANA
jgi:Zn-finger protein